jgi:phosphoribosylanthranilate isomerase
MTMNAPLFHVKICGVMTRADAGLAVDAGADAVGFNFVAGSPRRIEPGVAREAVASLPPDVLAVGVFAGMPADEIVSIARATGLGAIQLHGHLAGNGPAVDPPIRCAELAGMPVIRAVRMEADGLAAARAWLDEAARAGRRPDMLIIDAAVASTATAGVLGGTGARVDWDALRREAPLDLPIALAGGLTPENVAEAIAATGVVAVDTASGVEASPGIKDPARVQAFLRAARTALGHSGP